MADDELDRNLRSAANENLQRMGIRTSNPNNVEPYIWRFICAVYPSAPNLALASFSEEKALTDAADEIDRLTQAVELHRANTECARRDERTNIDRLEAQVKALKLQSGRDAARIAELARLLDEERDNRPDRGMTWEEATS